MLKVVALASLSLLLPAVTEAQNQHALEVCGKVISEGLRNYSVSKQDRHYLSRTHEQFCTDDSVKVGIDSSYRLTDIVDALPVALTGNSKGNFDKLNTFCKNYNAETKASSQDFNYTETIVEKAYESFNSCVRIANGGGEITHTSPTITAVNFFIAPGTLQHVQIDGVSISPVDAPVECQATVPAYFGFSSSTREMRRDSTYVVDKTLRVTCDRRADKDDQGAEAFHEVAITLLTELGNYTVTLPDDAKLPVRLASQIQGQLTSLEKRIDELKTALTAAEKKIPVGIKVDRNILYTGDQTQSSCLDANPGKAAVMHGFKIGTGGRDFAGYCADLQLVLPN